MSEDFIILEGKNLNKLINAGLEQLNKAEDQVDVDILEEGKTIAGISIRKYKIRLSIKQEEKVDYKTENKSKSKYSEVLNQEFTTQKVNNYEKLFKITYKEDGVYLSTDTKNNLKPRLEDITSTIEEKKINNVDYDLVKKTVDLGQNNLVKIAPSQEEFLLDSRVEIHICKDKMKAHMVLLAADGGKELSSDEIIKNLKEEIKFGLEEEKVRDIVEGKRYGIKEEIANGVLQVNGEDGYISYEFEQNKESTPSILDDGSVDFRSLNLITNVSKGDILATLHEPSIGSDGFNVSGEVLTHKAGMETAFNYGANISLSDDESKLISDIDGQVCMENKKIIVYEVYTISKDVDNSTGNIDFNGNVKIEGYVLTGFTVEAKGNIEIEGSVEGATIRCAGDLIINRGIQGYNMAKIYSGGNIFTKYIENTEIKCEKNIESEAIMHSDIECEGSIIIGGKKGLLVGGSCRSGEEISAKVIGSHMATATRLEVGLDPVIRDDQERLRELSKTTNADVDKFTKMINHLTKIDKEVGLDEDKKDMLDKSVVAKLQLEKESIDLRQQLKSIDEKINDSSNGKIKVEDVIYPGVRIIMGNSKMTIREQRDRCVIYRDMEDYEIKVGAFE